MFNFLKNWFNKNQSKGIPSAEIHQRTDTIKYTINIPGHALRVETDVFRATKKHLIEELDTPCWICGSKNNRQVHHFKLEASLANAADWTKVKALYPDFPAWSKIDSNDETTFKYFVDSVYNMMVLCQTHHVSRSQGIHCIPMPCWSFQKIKKDDFEFFPDSKGFFDYPVDDLSP
jgi:hypothetical protein